MLRKSLFAVTSLTVAMCASAQAERSQLSLDHMPLTEATRCVVIAAERHSVNPWILKAILKVESNFKPGAVNRNSNGTLDIGMAQINSVHLKELSKYGIAQKDLLDPCVSTFVAAWHLSKQYKQYGNTWFAVGAYHSATRCYNTRYVGLVWNALVDWKVVEATKMKVGSFESCSQATQSAKRASSVHVARTSSLLAFDE